MANLTPIIAKALAVTGFVGSLLTTATPANALSFNFSYTNQDPNVIGQTRNSSPNNTLLTASGVMDINRNAGQSFSNSDISNMNITVTDGTLSFVFTSWVEAGGVIAADGLSASFNAAGNPFVGNAFSDSFGCYIVSCNGSPELMMAFNIMSTEYLIDYNTQANALSAFKMTAATPVPFEFSPAVGLVGLGVVFGVKKFMTRRLVKNS